jgi:hypothetical protein
MRATRLQEHHTLARFKQAILGATGGTLMEWTCPFYTVALLGHDSCAMATIATQRRV